MQRGLLAPILIVILLVAAGFFFFTERVWAPAASPSEETMLANVDVLAPQAGAIITSPLSISGTAVGTWFFEASFPIRLLDEDGTELGIAVAQATSDWMTTEHVPFTATLSFTEPKGKIGTLVFEKDNPSGLPEHAGEYRLPVSF